jgi:predicted peptidase
MSCSEFRLVEAAPLPYLLSLPHTSPPAAGAWPLLCFLHGYGEEVPLAIEQALTRHGPLAATSSPRTTAEFIIVAAQLPTRGTARLAYQDERIYRWLLSKQ